MGVLLRQTFYLAPLALAADLASYSGSAQWRGIYYRGDKIGFSVGQTTPTDDGYEIREDARLTMTLVGATAAVRMTSRAFVDRLRAPALLVLARSRHRPDDDRGHPRRQAPRSHDPQLRGRAAREPRARRAAGAVAEPAADARGTRPRAGPEARRLGLRPGHAPQLADEHRGAGPRGGAGRRPTGPGVPRPGPARRSDDHQLGHRHGRGGQGGEPMGVRVVRGRPSRRGARGARLGAGRPARGRRARALHPSGSTIPHRREAACRIDGLSGLDPADLGGAGETASGRRSSCATRATSPPACPPDLERYLHARPSSGRRARDPRRGREGDRRRRHAACAPSS
jgi:hypothetical protein